MAVRGYLLSATHIAWLVTGIFRLWLDRGDMETLFRKISSTVRKVDEEGQGDLARQRQRQRTEETLRAVSIVRELDLT